MLRFIYILFLGIIICLNVDANAVSRPCYVDDGGDECCQIDCSELGRTEGCSKAANGSIACCGACQNEQTCEWYQVWNGGANEVDGNIKGSNGACMCVCSPNEPTDDEGKGVCPDGVAWDPNECACACGDTSEAEATCQTLIDGGGFYRWDEKTCSCVCHVPIGNIPPDKSWSSAECRWVCKGDGEGELENECVSRNDLGSSGPQWNWNRNECKCECVVTEPCPSGYEFDESSCTCNLITPEISGVCASGEMRCEIKWGVKDWGVIDLYQWCCRSDQQCGNMPNHCVEISTTPGEISTSPDVISTTPVRAPVRV